MWRRRRRDGGRTPHDAEPAADDDAFAELLLGLDVRAALEELSAKHREVLELQYAGGLTQQQISERLAIPLGTVKTRTYHALRAMRDKLEERDLLD
jgi:RNA polymerase sigma-70 factor, ECF subfamily